LLKNKDGYGRRIEKSKKMPYRSNSLTDFHEISNIMPKGSVNCPGRQKIEFCQYNMADGRHANLLKELRTPLSAM